MQLERDIHSSAENTDHLVQGSSTAVFGRSIRFTSFCCDDIHEVDNERQVDVPQVCKVVLYACGVSEPFSTPHEHKVKSLLCLQVPSM
jgi:hypothetical protein